MSFISNLRLLLASALEQDTNLDFVVTKQGSPRVNSASFLTTFKGKPEAVIVSLDLITKYTFSFGSGISEDGIPVYDIATRELFSDESLDVTTIAFPVLKGYKIVVSVDGGRYTHTLAFMKTN